jgi:F-type H+-transporting ATPase subunit epsilon
MADTLQLQIATPERQLVDQAVERVEVAGKDGYLGILPEHAPLLSALGAGVLSYTAQGQEYLLAIDGGFLEVLENHVRVLAEHAEFGREINLEQARKVLDEARAEVDRPQADVDPEGPLARMRAAQARVDTAERAR